MQYQVFIVPEDNRHEAIENWSGALTVAQIELIEEAPEATIIRLTIGDTVSHLTGSRCSEVLLIPEG